MGALASRFRSLGRRGPGSAAPGCGFSPTRSPERRSLHLLGTACLLPGQHGPLAHARFRLAVHQSAGLGSLHPVAAGSVTSTALQPKGALTLENVMGAWIKSQKVVCTGGKITEYRVTLKVTFVLKA